MVLGAFSEQDVETITQILKSRERRSGVDCVIIAFEFLAKQSRSIAVRVGLYETAQGYIQKTTNNNTPPKPHHGQSSSTSESLIEFMSYNH